MSLWKVEEYEGNNCIRSREKAEIISTSVTFMCLIGNAMADYYANEWLQTMFIIY
jgi:hypothetical protein